MCGGRLWMTVPRIMGVIRSRIRGFAVTHQQAVDLEGHASGVNDVPGLDTGAPGGALFHDIFIGCLETYL